MYKRCIECSSVKTYIDKQGRQRWYFFNDEGYICQKCYNKKINNPKITAEYRKKYNDKRTYEYQRKYNIVYGKRRIRFKGEQIFLKHNPRQGKCLKCHKKIGDEYINCKGQVAIIKQTHLHHLEYHIDEPLKDTFELCASCHAKER